MKIAIGQLVTLPRFQPYPRHGRIARLESDFVVVDRVICGDPRCAAEHVHGEQIWPLADVEAANAYQPRAAWEFGRRTSPNAPIA